MPNDGTEASLLARARELGIFAKQRGHDYDFIAPMLRAITRNHHPHNFGPMPVALFDRVSEAAKKAYDDA